MPAAVALCLIIKSVTIKHISLDSSYTTGVYFLPPIAIFCRSVTNYVSGCMRCTIITCHEEETCPFTTWNKKKQQSHAHNYLYLLQQRYTTRCLHCLRCSCSSEQLLGKIPLFPHKTARTAEERALVSFVNSREQQLRAQSCRQQHTANKSFSIWLCRRRVL